MTFLFLKRALAHELSLLCSVQIYIRWQMVAVAALVLVSDIGTENLFAGISLVWNEHKVGIEYVGIVDCCMERMGCVEQCA